MIELGSITPEMVLRKTGMLIDKPVPDSQLLEATIKNLPIPSSEIDKLQLLGCGDWGCGSSECGSAVMATGSYVLKIPLGDVNCSANVYEKAEELKKMSQKFAKVSPETCFFIARLDGENSAPKVIAFQKRNLGKPAYKTPLSVLLSRTVNDGLISVMEKIQKVFEEDRVMDISGLHFDDSSKIKKTMIKIITSIPWFSDNIMIDGNSVSLIDNTPIQEAHGLRNPHKYSLNLIRLKWSEKITSIASRVYTYFNKTERNEPVLVNKIP